MKKIIFFFLFSSFLAAKGISQAGTLDLSFGNNGHVLSPVSSQLTQYRDIAIQKDGKIITAGWTFDDYGAGGFFLVRYNKNGSLDAGFGNNGWLITPINGTGLIFSIAIQEDGKIIVGGDADGYDNLLTRFTLARYNINGTLDQSFGQNGIVQTIFPVQGWSELRSLKIQPDGKILAGGQIRIQTNTCDGYEFALARYNIDGSIDQSFGQNGLMIGNNCARLTQILLLDNEKILAVGTNLIRDDQGIYHPSTVLQRFNGDGSLDLGFGNNGFGATVLNCFASSAVIQKDGKILVGGSRMIFSGLNIVNDDFFLARYNPDGSMDTDFDEDGIVFTNLADLGYSIETGEALFVHADGKILLSGYTRKLNTDLALLRYKPDGSLDESFGDNGKVITDFGEDEWSFAMATDKERIYLSGWHRKFISSYAESGLLAAYQTGPSCNSSFEVAIPDVYTVNPGGAVNTVYIGYQSASSITLTASPSGGNAAYSYNWSTSPSQTTQQITVSPTVAGLYNYNVTVTDASNCTASATKTITAIDIRSDIKKGKIWICHRDLKGKWTTLSVLASSVADHLAHGDYLGICNNNSSNTELLTTAANETGNREIISEGFKIYPNPATHFLDVKWTTTNTSQSTIRILNTEGRVVKTLTTKGGVNNQRISLDGLARGIYMLVFKSGSDQQVSKFVIE